MKDLNKKKLGAIILAAGRGSRMKATKNANKVTMALADKPIILHAIDLLEKMNLSLIVIVVGFAKQSVLNIVKHPIAVFAEQTKRLGTAHAVKCALPKIPDDVTDVIVMNGDDSAFYTKHLISELTDIHFSSNAAVTFLTLEIENPFGLGRVIRDENDIVTQIVEEKDATEEQRKVTEVNAACYVFSMKFLKKYMKKIEKSPVTGEYYIVSLVELAAKNGEKIETMRGGSMPWRGVNSKEELEEAERLYLQVNGKV
jgi:bifunctional UDP-N-acetylglucosamine pyrophosphorylase/glucosamine-1-phosphate N-acetyltransferase